MQAGFDLVAVLFGLAALFGYINYCYLKLPHTIGLVVIALAVSFGLLAADAAVPAWGLGDAVHQALDRIDFTEVLMKGFLSFLLFAGALHVNLADLAKQKWAIGGMATFGVLLSTGLVGGGIWLVAQALDLALPFTYCLVFGALISPTDPVAVIGILKHVKVPPSLEAKIAGESLFNDGVGVVLFTIVVAIATGSAATTSAWSRSRRCSLARRWVARRSASAPAAWLSTPCGASTNTTSKSSSRWLWSR